MHWKWVKVMPIQINNGLLYNDDCRNVINDMVKNGQKVDLTVTSPPYDNLRTYNDTLEWNESVWKEIITGLYGYVFI